MSSRSCPLLRMDFSVISPWGESASFPLQPTPVVPHLLHLRRHQDKVKNKLVSLTFRDLRQRLHGTSSSSGLCRGSLHDFPLVGPQDDVPSGMHAVQTVALVPFSGLSFLAGRRTTPCPDFRWTDRRSSQMAARFASNSRVCSIRYLRTSSTIGSFICLTPKAHRASRSPDTHIPPLPQCPLSSNG